MKASLKTVVGAAIHALAAAATGGCGRTQYVAFRPAVAPVPAPPEWTAEGRLQVPPESAAVDVGLSARGVIDQRKSGASEQRLLVRMRMTNHGDQPFRVDPGAVSLADDDGREAAGAEVDSGGPRSGPIQVGPGQTAAYELILNLPSGARFETIGSLRLRWPYRYGDIARKAETKFLKIEEVHYYRPDYCDPWYYPYYDPYYYPYYWRERGPAPEAPPKPAAQEKATPEAAPPPKE